MSFEEIIEALPSLSAEQIEQLKAAIDLVGQVRSGEEVPDYKRSWEAVEWACAGKGVKVPPLRVVLKTTSAKQFRSKVPEMIKLVEEFQPQDDTERMLASRVVAHSLVDWMEQMKMPLIGGTVIRNMTNATVALDFAFPGYREKGNLGWILRK